ncbi:hypothetical protein HDZ31DRAFT_28360 [Schizophyllum fasciatum]
MSPQKFASNDTPRKRESEHPYNRNKQNADETGGMQLCTAQSYTRQCPVTDFYKAYVKPKAYARVATRTMDRIMDALRDRDVIDPVTGEWTVLRKTAGLGENEHFKGMEDVFAEVLEVAAKACPSRYSTDKRTTYFVCRPDCQTASEVPGASFRVDAMNYLSQSSYSHEAAPKTAHNHTATVPGQHRPEVVYTADAGATWELKLHDDESHILRNEQQTLNTARHMLYNDIRRTCHFSFTIEDSSARIWLHTRSHTIMTERFDIHTDASEFIQFILFSTFASQFQLGFDPTVRRVVVAGKLHYHFDVVDFNGRRHTYQSVKTEHDNAAADLYSRAMRVFKVIECGVKDSPHYVLRDYWLFDDEFTHEEWQIQEDILAALKTKLTAKEYKKIRRHFMTILSDGVVSHKRVRDAVPCPPDGADVYEYNNELNPNGTSAKQPKVTIASRGDNAPFKGPDPSKAPPPDLLNLHGRKHCRTVYLEHCEDLWHVKDPAKFYFALSEIMYILDNMRRAGYMHRDVSLGNVMLQTLATRSRSKDLSAHYVTKIADLEYARSYGQTSQHDPITGTCVLMAIEVQAGEHLFRNMRIKDLLTHGYFAFSFLHDVESVLWMALYFALRRCARTVYEQTLWQELGPLAQSVKNCTELIFVDDLHGSRPRKDIIVDPFQAENIRMHLQNMYGDDSPMIKLADLIDSLRDTYDAVENDTTVLHRRTKQFRDGDPNAPRLDQSVYDNNAAIYEVMRSTFREISQHYCGSSSSDTFVQFSDIDFSNGRLIGEAAAPPQAVGSAQVQHTTTWKTTKTTGKRKKADEEEGEGGGEAGSSRKHRASTKRSRRTQETPAAASDKSGGRSASRNGQPVARGRARTKSGPKPPAQPTRRSSRLAGLSPGPA